jgi:GT2 family glycosyltransferase
MNEGLAADAAANANRPTAAGDDLAGVVVSATAPAVRVDFASVFRDHLLVYGWILGLFQWVARAEIRHGDSVIDLMSVAIPVPRPDVTQHFASQVQAEDDNHGFCLLVALPDSSARSSYLRLSVTLHSGETLERVWPVGYGDAGVINFFQKNRATLYWLLQHLPPPEAGRLRELSGPAAPAAVKDERAAPHALQLQFGIDVCVLLDRRFLVVLGWLNERDRDLTAARATMVNGATLDLLEGMQFIARPSGDAKVLQTVRGEVVPQIGFTWVHALPAPISASTEVVFDVFAGERQMRARRVVSALPLDARGDLGSLFPRMDADGAIGLIERIALLDDSARSTIEWLATMHAQAVERLPTSLPGLAPRCLLHFDSVTPIADEGVYLAGWYSAEPGAITRVSCDAGFASSRIDDTWVRVTRMDVTTHLNTLGIASAEHNHGIAAFVPLPNKGAAYFVALTFHDGAVRRLRLQPAAAMTALATVRAVLTSFHVGHRALRKLLDLHVGPAVERAWRHRTRLEHPVTLDRFGVPPTSPRVSIIVPLYGRYDLADYQLALFADDPDFQTSELIYFVDDPAIYDDFRAQCRDLFETYRVPFTVAFAGANLGFAGANNRAASVATAGHLLLMNSDVLPKRPGWLGKLLALHGSLDTPGPLGVKLLYEDGSVQHAGMTFRRYAPWGDLWINDHLQKGQSPLGLSGVRNVEAVTAACMLVETALYRELGGLSEDYIIGDFEDSDFCLRAAAAGRRSSVALNIELYHVERQSQDRIGDAQWRTNLTIYNCWQHHARWAGEIERQQK